MTEQLTSPAVSVSEARLVVGLLKRMHLENQARHMFLNSRSQHIQSGIKQVKKNSIIMSYLCYLFVFRSKVKFQSKE